jgi:hypothetical protein
MFWQRDRIHDLFLKKKKGGKKQGLSVLIASLKTGNGLFRVGPQGSISTLASKLGCSLNSVVMLGLPTIQSFYS